MDWNIIISLQQGELDHVLTSLQHKRKAGEILLPFSATHVEEARSIKGPTQEKRHKWIAERLDFLSNLTDNLYLYNAINTPTPYLIEEHPRDVYATLSEMPWAQGIMNWMIKAFGSPKRLRSNRSVIGVDPSRLNSIEPPNVIEQIDQIVQNSTSGRSEKIFEDFGVRKLLETSLQYYPPSYHGFENQVAVVFSALNSLGFWPDRGNDSAAVAGFHDSSHAAAAAYTDVLASNDKRMRIKTAAAYEFFGVTTQIVDGEGLALLL